MACSFPSAAQTTSPPPEKPPVVDSAPPPAKHWQVHFYADLYWGTAFRPGQSQLPYLVSHQKTGGPQANVLAAEIQFQSARWRSRIVPAWGTYLQANYAAEPKGLAQHLVEASLGFKPFRKQKIWLEGGILSSPITNENTFSLDQLLLSRSFAPEFSPYFLTGVKLVLPLDPHWTASLYAINGWQTIRQQNKNWAGLLQIEYRPNNKDLFNGNLYVGNEEKATQPWLRNRSLLDFYWVHQSGGKWQYSAGIYGGQQSLLAPSTGKLTRDQWWQWNLQARWRFRPHWWLAGRTEYFSDPNARIVPLNGLNTAFQQWSQSISGQTQVGRAVMLRLEYRFAWGPTAVYEDRKGQASTQQHWLLGGLALRL